MTTHALNNQLALVTGASRGMGAATAKRLAREGAAVLVHYAASADRAEAVMAEIHEAGGRAEAVGADLRTPDGIQHLVDAVDTAFDGAFDGRLHILVNNAGAIDFGPFLDTADDAYDRHFDLNVRAPVELTKKLAPRMVEAEYGRIINVSSSFGEAAPVAGVTLYMASKFAVHGFTRALSRELGSHGITVNGIQPGPIATELSPPPGTPEHEAFTAMTSVGRFGEPDEVAAATAFLARPESAFINGENFTIDGGTNA